MVGPSKPFFCLSGPTSVSFNFSGKSRLRGVCNRLMKEVVIYSGGVTKGGLNGLVCPERGESRQAGFSSLV